MDRAQLSERKEKNACGVEAQTRGPCRALDKTSLLLWSTVHCGVSRGRTDLFLKESPFPLQLEGAQPPTRPACTHLACGKMTFLFAMHMNMGLL